MMALSSTYEEMLYNYLMWIFPGCGYNPDARDTTGKGHGLSAAHTVGNG